MNLFKKARLKIKLNQLKEERRLMQKALRKAGHDWIHYMSLEDIEAEITIIKQQLKQ